MSDIFDPEEVERFITTTIAFLGCCGEVSKKINDVEAGGQTVFPTAFSAANPMKGSALYWFNLFSDGSPDYSSVHGGCPILLGEKWST